MSVNQNHASSQQQVIERARQRREIRYHIVSYVLMLFLTALAFITVGYGFFNGPGAVMFILILAVFQVIFQLYYFMHLKDKGHGYPALFIFSGVFVAILTIAAFTTLIW